MQGLEQGAGRIGQGADWVKPRLRGWLHLGAFPLALVAGMVLVALGPTVQARLVAAVYALTSALLFGVSALYHRGRWSARTEGLLRRLDHANIYLIIAGTYTPFAALVLDGAARAIVLSVVWCGAVAGVLFRVLWVRAPRWLYTALYIGLGWAAAFFVPQFLEGAGWTVATLVIAGGVLYSLGGLVYGLRRPDPSPRWFGFHEVFHALTVAAYALQYIAVSVVVHRAGPL
ncbi:PAQR family membrane homeostasis protein TrhA [Thermomonospora catenispora]|uniref:PAQR family membrane homeostasis protein TrhA n=1 Tax=Thermomonospora catenispora TaxID=2493090 RepID=UPI00111F4E5D|nr:hemolysin III family protein [Thermomonospora catenispora]TNY37488.1 hemolysin III family protein [Thermomonospora catenispora]